MSCISSKFHDDISAMIDNIAGRIVHVLASEYGFSEEDALLKLKNVTTPPITLEGDRDELKEEPSFAPEPIPTAGTTRDVPTLPLPFCGVIKEEWCQGIRCNYNLHTQCVRAKYKDEQLCQTCLNACKKNAGKPPLGFIRDRDPDHKKIVRYSTVMKKRNISREAAEEEAARFQMVIPEIEFEDKPVKRGRPSNGGGKRPLLITTIKTTCDIERERASGIIDESGSISFYRGDEVDIARRRWVPLTTVHARPLAKQDA